MENSYLADRIPPNEPQRLEALKRYRIIGTDAEKSFTGMAEMAGYIFNVPVAIISLVGDKELFCQSNIGLEVTTMQRNASFCAITVANAETCVIEDALSHPELEHHPMVTGNLALRFYAGAPLLTPEGYPIGTMCIAHQQPRDFGFNDKAILEGMAKIVMEQIELRLGSLHEAEKQKAINEQLKQSNDKLTASEQRFQNILNTMAEGVGIIDTTGRIIYANKMAEQMFGLTQNQINERTYDDPRWENLRIDGTPLPGDEHPMAIMMHTGLAVHDYEISIQPSNGERFYISINAAPIIDEETQKITGGIGTFMDVTTRRKLTQQKDEFISVASHELKTPVTSLKASMQIMNRMKDSPNAEVMARMIAQSNKSLDKLTGLIKDLLDSNRISEGQLHLRKSTFTIGNLLSDCCSHVRTAGTHEITLEGDIDLQINADEQQVDQVIVNLVNNAVKYAPQSKHIYVNVQKKEKEVKVSVQDNGPGIPPDKIPHLFDRYFRADYSGVQFSGLGLGLYICAEIIKKHGGRIGVDSELGKGATFWFTLPL